MSDTISLIAKQSTAQSATTDMQIRQDTNKQIQKQFNSFDEKSVILSVENNSIEKQSATTKNLSEDNPLLNNVSRVSVYYDEKIGIPVVRFLDSKGNTVLQVPPEEYLKMKEQDKEKGSPKIPDIINKKV